MKFKNEAPDRKEEAMMGIATRMTIGRRQLARIEQQVGRLRERLPGTDAEKLIRFARGRQALAAYQSRLSDAGRNLLQKIDVVLAEESFSEETIDRLLPELPSASRPQLGLYLEPFSIETLSDSQFKAFRLEFNKPADRGSPLGKYRVIQISTGCFNNCLMCCDAHESDKIWFMPLPMILLLARQLVDVSAWPGIRVVLYQAGDPLQWRDANLDADFGDLAAQLKQLGIPLAGQVTYGLWPGDDYAESAAGKSRQAGVSWGLSIHLLRREVFPTPEAVPSEEKLVKHAQRFAHSIEALEPCEIRLLADGERNPNPYLRLSYLKQFYNQRVVPLLGAELRQVYGDNSPTTRGPGLRRIARRAAAVSSLGRAAGSPYFHDFQPRGDASYPADCLHLMIGIRGSAQVYCVEKSSQPEPPNFSNAQTVKEIYPAAQSREFTWLLLKLKFLFASSTAPWSGTKELWQRCFAEHTIQRVRGLLRGVEQAAPERINALYEELKDLPVISRDLYPSLVVAELSSFESYLYALVGKDEESFLCSFQQGRGALNEIWQRKKLYSAISRKDCTPEQLKEAFEILKDLPVFQSRLAPLKTRAVLPIHAKVS